MATGLELCQLAPAEAGHRSPGRGEKGLRWAPREPEVEPHRNHSWVGGRPGGSSFQVSGRRRCGLVKNGLRMKDGR